MELRIDEWVKAPATVEQLEGYLGKHMVAYPFGSTQDKAGGHFIGLDPEKQTVSLRRYDNAEVREFPLSTTDFRYTTAIESPFTGLKPGDERRFEWFDGFDGMPLEQPTTFVGRVSQVKPDVVFLWVTDPEHRQGGWRAEIKASNADRHALRPLDLKQDQ